MDEDDEDGAGRRSKPLPCGTLAANSRKKSKEEEDDDGAGDAASRLAAGRWQRATQGRRKRGERAQEASVREEKGEKAGMDCCWPPSHHLLSTSPTPSHIAASAAWSA